MKVQHHSVQGYNCGRLIEYPVINGPYANRIQPVQVSVVVMSATGLNAGPIPVVRVADNPFVIDLVRITSHYCTVFQSNNGGAYSIMRDTQISEYEKNQTENDCARKTEC